MNTSWTYELNGHTISVKGQNAGQGGGHFYMIRCSCGAMSLSTELYIADPVEETKILIPEYREKYSREGWPKDNIYTYEAVVAAVLAHVGYAQKDADEDSVKPRKARNGWADPECWEVAQGTIGDPSISDVDAVSALARTLSDWAKILQETKDNIILAQERVKIFEGMKAGINFDEAWHNFHA